MSEQLREESDLYIEFPDIEDVSQYYRKRITEIREGKPVWMQRNFDADLGRVIDFYNDREHLGSIQQDYGYGCDVYVNREKKPVFVVGQVQLEEAQRVLLDITFKDNL